MPKYRERPPLGYFWMQPDDKDIGFLDGMLGRQHPTVVEGYSKWARQNRRRRRAAIRFDGSEPLAVRFDVLLTTRSPRARQDDSVEDDIRQLEKMAGLVTDGYEPPMIEWAANGPHDYFQSKSQDWVVDDLVWSEDPKDIQWNDKGRRTMLHGTVTLAVFTPVTYIKADVPKSMQQKKKEQKKKKKGGAKSSRLNSYTVKTTDRSLLQIAANELGSASRYTEIAALNGLRDPREISVGDELQLP